MCFCWVFDSFVVCVLLFCCCELFACLGCLCLFKPLVCGYLLVGLFCFCLYIWLLLLLCFVLLLLVFINLLF